MPAAEYLPHGFFLSLDVMISCYVLTLGPAPRAVSRIQSNEWSMTFWSQLAKLTKCNFFLQLNSTIANFWCELSLYTKFLRYMRWDLPKTPPSGQIKGAKWLEGISGVSIHKWKPLFDWLYSGKGIYVSLKQLHGDPFLTFHSHLLVPQLPSVVLLWNLSETLLNLAHLQSSGAL